MPVTVILVVIVVALHLYPWTRLTKFNPANSAKAESREASELGAATGRIRRYGTSANDSGSRARTQPGSRMKSRQSRNRRIDQIIPEYGGAARVSRNSLVRPRGDCRRFEHRRTASRLHASRRPACPRRTSTAPSLLTGTGSLGHQAALDEARRTSSHPLPESSLLPPFRDRSPASVRFHDVCWSFVACPYAPRPRRMEQPVSVLSDDADTGYLKIIAAYTLLKPRRSLKPPQSPPPLAAPCGATRAGKAVSRRPARIYFAYLTLQPKGFVLASGTGLSAKTASRASAM